jgi:type VI secretion system secreted protein VgrG
MQTHDIRIESDSPIANELMFWSLVGHEGLSHSACYELTVLSKNGHVQPKDVLGRAFDVCVDFVDDEERPHARHCHGHAVRFVREGRIGRYHRYSLTLRSWFWLLTKRRNSRIFQDQPVLDVLGSVFEDSPVRAIRKTDTHGVIGTHAPHRYCVQFQESDHDFVSRLLEAEGVYYWFDAHGEPGRMHFADASFIAHKRLPATPVLRFASESGEARFNEIRQWVSAQRLDAGRHAARDSDFKAIRKNLGASIDAADAHELADFEEFEYPGDYFDAESAETVARIRGEELIARRDRHWAVTTWPDVAAGCSFMLEGDAPELPRGEHLIGACSFVVTHPGYEGIGDENFRTAYAERLCALAAGDAVNEGAGGTLSELIRSEPALQGAGRGLCVFFLTTLPMQLPFRPPRLTPRVTMPGPQTAIVVGPAGDELHVDEHGRVKVHFHWDRYDQSNEKSTCWVRVSQPWAGKGWGGYFAPRIGQEVIVDFLNGDPDRPVIVGRVYNDDQPIPYKSPTQSGFKTRSTPGGDASNYNEIRFEDRKGEELLSVHAERDMRRSVERDDTTDIGRDQRLRVDRDQHTHVQRDQTLRVDNERKLHVRKNESHQVDLTQRTKIGEEQHLHVVSNQATQVDGEQSTVVKGNLFTHTQSSRQDMTDGDERRLVKGNQTFIVEGDLGYKATNMTFEAEHIDFKVTGANSMVLESPDGPYSIIANKFTLASNTDASIIAVGNINQISIENNVTAYGNNNGAFFGFSSDVTMGLARSTTLGISIDSAIGGGLRTAYGFDAEMTAGYKMSVTTATDIETTPMKIFTPPGMSPPNTGPVVLSESASWYAVAAGVSTGFLSGLAGLVEWGGQGSDAEKELKEVAQAAANAGHVGLAARLRRLFDDGAGSMAEDAPANTRSTKGDDFTKDYYDYSVDPQTPGRVPKLGDLDYERYEKRADTRMFVFNPEKSFGGAYGPQRPKFLDEPKPDAGEADGTTKPRKDGEP